MFVPALDTWPSVDYKYQCPCCGREAVRLDQQAGPPEPCECGEPNVVVVWATAGESSEQEYVG